MKYISTRGKSPALSFTQAIAQGLAPDGGLYVPEKFPRLNGPDFKGMLTLSETAKRVLRPWVDEGLDLDAVCERAFNFQVPLVSLKNSTAVLELFHGPTAAFKDVGARFLAETFASGWQGEGSSRTVLVATSGDTGGAVAAAFHGRAGFQVVVLYPRGKISARQEKQLTAWGGNVRAFAVRGDFDSCQKMVKEAFQDAALRARHSFISANSISIGRLLPQAVYYAKATADYLRETGEAPGFIVPTGNLGNAVAALWAKAMGFPIREVVLATNANRAIPDFISSGVWKSGTTITTLANAMDVGNPSNMERLRHLYPLVEDLRRDVSAISVSDEQIRAVIRQGLEKWGRVWCPHTATAVFAREARETKHWIVVATAHPAKFESIVEPLIGREVAVPESLQALLHRESRSVEIDPDLESLKRALI